MTDVGPRGWNGRLFTGDEQDWVRSGHSNWSVTTFFLYFSSSQRIVQLRDSGKLMPTLAFYFNDIGYALLP